MFKADTTWTKKYKWHINTHQCTGVCKGSDVTMLTEQHTGSINRSTARSCSAGVNEVFWIWMMCSVQMLVTQTHSQLPYPYWSLPLKTADTFVISREIPSPGCSSTALWPIDRLWISKLGERWNMTWLYDSLRVHLCIMVVCALLLFQAIYDCAYKEQGRLSLHTGISGMLERCLNHFGCFLVHCPQRTNTHMVKDS